MICLMPLIALLLAALLMVSPARAQPGDLFPTVMDVSLPAGTGRLLQLPAAANTIMAANPDVVRVQPTSPTTVFIMAVNPGRTNIIATNNEGRPIVEYNVTVVAAQATGAAGGAVQAPRATQADIRQLQAVLRQSVPGAQNVTLRSVAGRVLVSGTVPTADDARRVMAVLGTALGEEPVVNDLAVLSALTVNVRVRVAEISRQITRELGLSWSTFGSIGSFAIGMQSGLNLLGAAPIIPPRGLAGPGSLMPPRGGGLGFGVPAADINGLVDALARDSLITILAEPNLTALSGETASFLAGGEFPVPVAAALTGQISVQFRQFGVSLAFVPTVLAPDRLNLRIRPEVSELSEQGAINIPVGANFIRIPALAVRRAETTVELGSGQSFAIAGLLQRSTSQVSDGPFGLADLPVLGPLFRSDRFRRNETELVIIVTPYVVRPVSDPTALATPMDNFRSPNDLERILQMRQLGTPPAPVRMPRDAGFILD